MPELGTGEAEGKTVSIITVTRERDHILLRRPFKLGLKIIVVDRVSVMQLVEQNRIGRERPVQPSRAASASVSILL
jgi:hypothetical protein